MGLLAALAVGGMAAGLAGRRAGAMAAALFYSWPGATVYSAAGGAPSAGAWCMTTWSKGISIPAAFSSS